MTIDHRRGPLSPVFEGQQPALPSAPALTVHVEIQFTDPIIRSRYTRSYGSSADFAPTPRICKGLLRRIERCSQELLTRKDSAAMDMFKDGTFERKPLRYEIAFRITTREGGGWAERLYRSYQKQPLTVGVTKDIILASHRIVGLFLRRHDEGFRWLDGAVRDTSLEGPQTTSPSIDGPLSLLCVPGSRFIESSQSFEFVPGYNIELSFWSRNPQRRVPVFGRSIRISSEQTAPLTLFMSEDLLWRGLQAVNQSLEPRKQAFDAHQEGCRGGECHHSDDESINIELRVANNLGPVYSHVCRSVQSKLALFRDLDARDCDKFLQDIEATLANIRGATDTKIEELNDFELRIVELKGSGWSVRQPAKFSLDSAVSYGRRTILAALDRIQTGIADVLRGYDVAIHVSGYKRGHLILDKAIVAHAKRGIPKEFFSSPEEAQTTFISRLKARIQRDIDMIFEDTCSIDDIPEEETMRSFSTATIVGTASNTEKPTLSLQEELSPSEPPSLPTTPVKEAPKPRVQRMFSLSSRRSPRTDTESVRSARSINDLRSETYSTKATSIASEDISENASVLSEDRPPIVVVAPIKLAQRRFPLISKRYSSRVSNASTLIEEFKGGLEGINATDFAHDGSGQQVGGVEDVRKDTLRTVDAPEDVFSPPSCVALDLMTSGEAKSDHVDVDTRMNPAAGPQMRPVNGSGSSSEQPSCIEAISQPKMDSPDAFEDAEEFAPGPGLPEISKLETPSPNVDLASPGVDAYSTAPSTPGLSTGADSSPRNSVLITPTYLRTLSGTRDPVLRDFEPESDSEGTAMGIVAEIAAAPVDKAAKDTDRIPADAQPTETCPLSPAPEIIAREAAPMGGSDRTALEADVRVKPVNSEQTTTEPELDSETTEDVSTSNGLSQLGKLGAECTNEQPDDCGAQEPDFPTNPVEASDPCSETISQSPGPSGNYMAELVADKAFGPANLWGIPTGLEEHAVADADSGAETPANLWGILTSSGLQFASDVEAEPHCNRQPSNTAHTRAEASDLKSAEEALLPAAEVTPRDRLEKAQSLHSDGPEATDGDFDKIEIAEARFGGVDRDPSEPIGPPEETGDLQATEEKNPIAPGVSADVVAEQEEAAGPEANAVKNKSDQRSVIEEAETPDGYEIAGTRSQSISDIVHGAVPGSVAEQLVDKVQPHLETSEVDDRVSEINANSAGDEDIPGSRAIVSAEIPECVDTSGVQGQDAVVSDEAVEPEAQSEARHTDEGVFESSETFNQDSTGDEDLKSPSGEPNGGVVEPFKTQVNKERDVSPADLDVPSNIPSDPGSEIENVIPELGDDKPVVVAPEISVQDFAASVPEGDLAIDVPSNPTQTTEDLASEHAKPDKPTPVAIPTAFNPLYLTPSPVPSPRTSTSSFSVGDWFEYQSLASTRGSVETVRPAESDDQEECPPSSERCQSRPQTAGLLGLRDSRVLDVGLRGALGDHRRRYSLPLQNLLADQDATGGESISDYVTAVETPISSVVGGRVKKHGKRRLRLKKDERAERITGEEPYEPPVVPRVVMLLAGVVALGKMLRGPSK